MHRTRRACTTLLAAASLVAGTACYRTSRTDIDANAKTVLEVDNQGFDDMNIFVIPEGGARLRLGSAIGKSKAYLTIPRYVLHGSSPLRFQALPIATQRGPVSEDIAVTPGDTVVLTIPPTGA